MLLFLLFVCEDALHAFGFFAHLFIELKPRDPKEIKIIFLKTHFVFLRKMLF